MLRTSSIVSFHAIVSAAAITFALLGATGCGGTAKASTDKSRIQSIVQSKSTIFDAVKVNDDEAIAYFIDEGVDLDAVDETGSAPLHYAVAAGKLETVKLLILAGANPLVTDAQGETALSLAEQSGNAEIATALADASVGWEGVLAQNANGSLGAQ